MPQFTKPQFAIPALIVFLAVAAGGAQLWGQHVARVRLDETLASLPAGSSGHYTEMSYNIFTRTARIENLQVTRGGQRSLSVREIVLHRLGGHGLATDPFRAASVRLDDLEVWRGGHSVTAALIQAQNIAVLPPGVPPPAGTPGWLVAPDAATVLAAGSATVDGIADDQGATLGAISISGYDDGHLQQVSAGHFADRQGDRIRSADAAAIDLDGLDRVFDTGRYTPDAANWSMPRTLIGHAEIAGFASTSAGAAGSGAAGTGGFDSLVLDGFAARPFRAAPTAAYVKSSAFARDALESLAFGSLSLAGLHFMDSQTKVSGKLGTLTATGYADGALGHFSVLDLAVSGQAQEQMTVGQFTLTGLTATKLLHAPAGASTDSLIAAAGNGGVRLDGMDMAAVSVTASSGVPITIAAFTEAVSGTAPVQSTLSLRGLSIPARANPDLAQVMADLGVDPLVIDLDEAGSFDAATGDTTIKQMVLTARGLGTLRISGQLTNVPHQGTPSDTGMAVLARLSQIGIGPFTVQYSNDALLQRLVAAQARQTGKTPEDVMNQMQMAASFMAAGLVPAQPDAGEQVAAFMADPKTLTISASPAAPIPLGLLTGPTLEAAQKALNLKLSGN